jgi:hypothetical protein
MIVGSELLRQVEFVREYSIFDLRNVCRDRKWFKGQILAVLLIGEAACMGLEGGSGIHLDHFRAVET